MSFLHIAVLALIQGITEFLPISSSAHLRLAEKLMSLPDQGFVLIVAVHVGSLGAVMLYFWRDLWAMAAGIGQLSSGRREPGALLAGWLIVATIPVLIAGFALKHFLSGGPDGIVVIAWTTLGFGVLLFITDKIGMTVRRIEHLGFGDAVFIGLAQVLALIPGVSRSAITMSAARLLGLERTEAARFSMLLSIPAIIGAGTLVGIDLYRAGDAALTQAVLIAAGLAYVSALISIFALMAWLKKSTFTPFVVYRILLGGFLLAVAYGWMG